MDNENFYTDEETYGLTRQGYPSEWVNKTPAAKDCHKAMMGFIEKYID
ncbi:MAG: hypothetical protein J6C84_05335 [Lachnospiraceae bacterium]|nr:hypothetical protein [Lachnospiraceae bacterium]